MEIIKDKTTKVAVNIGIYVAILIALHLFVGRSIFRLVSKEKDRYENFQKSLLSKEKLIKAIPNPRKEIEEIREKIKDLEKKSIFQDKLPRIIQQLTKETRKLNIEIISIKPIEKSPFEEENLPLGVKKVYLEITLKTSYINLGHYLKAIEKLPIIFTIESLVVRGFEEIQEKDFSKEVGNDLIATLLIGGYKIESSL